MDGPRNFDDSDQDFDIEIKSPSKEEKKEGNGNDGKCPKLYRCVWKFTHEGKDFEGKTEWMCRCRAVSMAEAGVEKFGKGTHWVEEKEDK